MKVRKGFVSNSSTSSFLIYGICREMSYEDKSSVDVFEMLSRIQSKDKSLLEKICLRWIKEFTSELDENKVPPSEVRWWIAHHIGSDIRDLHNADPSLLTPMTRPSKRNHISKRFATLR